MNSCFILILAALSAVASYGQSDPKLPETWYKELVIEFTHSGSMDGSMTTGRFTYDSCIFTHQSGHKKPVKGTYKMKAGDRQAIMKKLHDLKVDQIKGKLSNDAVHDGWRQSISIGDLFMSGGPSIEMTEDSRLRFGQTYHYLEEFAITKTHAR
jgi:hypothetical protein